MEQPDGITNEEHFVAILDKLVEFGWLELTLRDASGKYVIKWTPKGRERAAWVKTLAGELNLGPKGMLALLAFCELHGKSLD